jgi:hypothetical protein
MTSTISHTLHQLSPDALHFNIFIFITINYTVTCGTPLLMTCDKSPNLARGGPYMKSNCWFKEKMLDKEFLVLCKIYLQ